MVSILILTKNEEADLPGCLESVRWSDDIHVFDSFSSDRTPEVARRFEVHIRQRVFDDYATHRNAALQECAFRHRWVLMVDADERIPAALASEIAERLSDTGDGITAFRIRRRDYLMGTWLKHAQISPFYVRLVRPEKVHYERAVNEVLMVDGQIADLQQPFEHFPFSKGMHHWIDKHNRYSTMEAEQVIKARRTVMGRGSLVKALMDSDFNVRRFHQKDLFYRMPCRPLLKFGYMMAVRRAFLDGQAGIIYAVLQSIYEYFIVLKTKELETTPLTSSGV